MRYLPFILLVGCLAELSVSDERALDWSDCKRSEEPCPAHGIAYECDAAVEIPEHCDWLGQLVCCEYLPPVDVSLPAPPIECERLDDPEHKLCPVGIAHTCRVLPPHCQWSESGPPVACCMPLI